MTPIRVLLVGMAPILRDIVRQAVERQEDMEVVAEAAEGHRLRAEVEGSGAGVVIVGLEDADAVEACAAVVAERPATKVLGLEADGRRGILYALRVPRVALDDLSPEGLVAAVRAASVDLASPAGDAGGDAG